MKRAIEVVGHGGAGDFYPGNSRRAIEQALELGVDRIEIDVQQSADHELVLVHDDKIHLQGHRLADVGGLSTAALRAHLPGLLTLDEAVALIAGRAPLMLDVKRRRDEDLLIQAIRRHALATGSSVSSTNGLLLFRLRRAFPEMRLGLSTGHWSSGAPTRIGRVVTTAVLRAIAPYPMVATVKACGATEVMLFHRVCTRYVVDTLHRHNVRINAWTVDRPSSIRRVACLGVDGIITNRPDLAWETLASGGIARRTTD
ncbi:MAG: glycerophosphodiester phosphodiesterase [Thermomicrobiales bacterium]